MSVERLSALTCDTPKSLCAANNHYRQDDKADAPHAEFNYLNSYLMVPGGVDG